MLWLCIRLPQLAREALAANTRAAMESTMERLAAWAYQWSSQVSYHLSDPPLLWLELGASHRLFGGYAALMTRLEAGLTQLGYQHACALAPSAHGAALLTQLERQRCVYTRAQLRLRLEPLPLRLLELPSEITDALHSAGLRSIGQLLRLPATAIARRFGPQTSVYLRRLLGQQSDPRPSWQLPPTYHARCEFGCELRDTTAMLFPLQRLLLEFQGYLRGRDCAVQRFTLRLEHYRHPASELIIGLSAPGREAAQFLQLVRERLHDLVLPAAVSGLALEAHEFTSPSVVQADFFGSNAQQLQQLQLLLDRLRARLGTDHVQGLQPEADYRPERAWSFAPPATTQHDHNGVAQDQQPARPCFLTTDLQRVAPPARLLSGPERIESGWWDRADAARDYYIAEGQDGARLWVFRDLSNGGWYLQGLWT
ncbi:MAG TPA: DNA polymerase Y family protein [Steroidobacteraceae bacterium]|nr:DNA polymerase Y family protein [Steroidobacteraceae bacterium]